MLPALNSGYPYQLDPGSESEEEIGSTVSLRSSEAWSEPFVPFPLLYVVRPRQSSNATPLHSSFRVDLTGVNRVVVNGKVLGRKEAGDGTVSIHN